MIRETESTKETLRLSHHIAHIIICLRCFCYLPLRYALYSFIDIARFFAARLLTTLALSLPSILAIIDISPSPPFSPRHFRYEHYILLALF